jgi:hypothetical protein
VDNRVGDLPKRSKIVNAKANTFEYYTVDFDITAMNDEEFALAA